MLRMTALRIGTAERERAAADLGEHFTAGRLTTEEFDERVQFAYQARTEDDLTPLFADLPPLRRPQPPARRRGFGYRLTLIMLLVVACVAWVAILRVPPFFAFPLVWIFFAARRRFAHNRF